MNEAGPTSNVERYHSKRKREDDEDEVEEETMDVEDITVDGGTLCVYY